MAQSCFHVLYPSRVRLSGELTSPLRHTSLTANCVRYSALLPNRDKPNANRRPHFDRRAVRFQRAGFLIELEHHDLVDALAADDALILSFLPRICAIHNAGLSAGRGVGSSPCSIGLAGTWITESGSPGNGLTRCGFGMGIRYSGVPVSMIRNVSPPSVGGRTAPGRRLFLMFLPRCGCTRWQPVCSWRRALFALRTAIETHILPGSQTEWAE